MLPLLLIAQAEGKHPAIAAQEYDIIAGRPALNSRSALARFQTAGGRIKWLLRTDTEVSAEFSHQQGGELVISWTFERATRAGLTGKDNWKKFPAQMLASRVVGEGVRAILPGCLSGFYTTEEVQDFDDRPERPARRVSPERPAEKIAEPATPTEPGEGDETKPTASTPWTEPHPYWKSAGNELKKLFDSEIPGPDGPVPIFQPEEIAVYKIEWKKIGVMAAEKIPDEVDRFVAAVKMELASRTDELTPASEMTSEPEVPATAEEPHEPAGGEGLGLF
jgi:hypothetical protein